MIPKYLKQSPQDFGDLCSVLVFDVKRDLKKVLELLKSKDYFSRSCWF